MTDVNYSQTADLDEAQKTTEDVAIQTSENVKKFIVESLKGGLTILFTCIISFYLIYSCKLAHANILPTDKNCYPYTNQEPKIVYNPINIFTNFPFSQPRVSMKIKFTDYKSPFVDSLMTNFRDIKADQQSGFIINFAVAVIESTFVTTYGCYNTILSFLNSLPEFLLLIFGKEITTLVVIIGIFVSIVSFIFYWFSNIHWMFKKNTSIIIDTDGEVYYKCGTPQWSSVRWKSPDPKMPGKSEWISVLLGVGCVLICLLVFNIALGLLPFIAIAFNLFIIFSFFSYPIELGNTEDDLSFSTLPNLFSYFFKYNKLIIMILFSYNLVKNAYNILGTTAAGVCLVIVLIIYFSRILDMFVQNKGERGAMINDIRPVRELCPKPDTSENCVTPTTILDGKFSSASQIKSEAANEAAKHGMAQPINPNNMNQGMGMGQGMGMVQGMPPQTGGIKKKFAYVHGKQLMKKLKMFNKKYGKFLV